MALKICLSDCIESTTTTDFIINKYFFFKFSLLCKSSFLPVYVIFYFSYSNQIFFCFAVAIYLFLKPNIIIFIIIIIVIYYYTL